MSQARRMSIGPGRVLGLVGGGQLGRMTALAARSLGYRVHALDPDPACPVRGVCDEFIQGSLDDPHAAARLAARADVVTCEREDVGPGSLCAIAEHAPLRPGPHVLETVQDRGVQKRWLTAERFPVGPFSSAQTLTELREAVERFGPGARIKLSRGGFDGRGQWRASEMPLDSLWDRANGASVIVEQDLDLEAELSVLVARSVSGEMAVHPVSHNFHTLGALETSVMPALLPPALQVFAANLARDMAERLSVVGLLVVEMFWTRDGNLLVNELAPRPHNSFHGTEWACVTSQFEQLVRAVCDLPLGQVDVRVPTAIANLYGDLWLDGRQGALVDLLGQSGTHLRLYDKSPRPRRKLGHLACTASTPERALACARETLAYLNSSRPVRHAS